MAIEFAACGDVVTSDRYDQLVWPESLARGFEDCDAGVFMAAVEVISSGLFTGGDVAKLLERLIVRLEAVLELQHVGDGLISERKYNTLVASLEKQMGLPGTSLRTDVMELEIVARLFGDTVSLPYGVKVQDSGCVGGCVPVAGGNAQVWTFASVGMARPQADQLIMTSRVYRALLGLAVDYVSDIPQVYVSQRSDGIFELKDVPEGNASVGCYALPAGQYLLPGGFGCLVSAVTIQALLEAVWLMPVREKQRGLCYLRVVPPASRVSVLRTLGSFPTVSDLVGVCPEVYTWVSRIAKVESIQDSGTGAVHYHVVTSGTLPGTLATDVVVGGDGTRGAHIDVVFQDFEKRLASKGASALAPPSGGPGLTLPDDSVGVPRRLGDSGSQSLHVRSASAGSAPDMRGVVGFRTPTPVFQLQPGSLNSVGPVWTEYQDATTREWASRLAGGPPLGATVLQELCNARQGDLPRLPVGEGGRMIAIPPAVMTGHKLAVWRTMLSPIPGWTLEKLGPTSSPMVTAVSPMPGILCRYEVSSNDPVEVNGVVVPGHRSLFWCDGKVVMSKLGRHAAIWRMWHEAGSCALGPDLMSLHISYLCPVVVPARRDNAQTLCAKLCGSDDSRGEQLYRATCRATSGESEVRIYMADVASSEAIVLGVTAPGLVQVMLHGVVIPAVGGSLLCVTDIVNLALTCCVSNDRFSRKGGDIVFEIRRTRGIGVTRARVSKQQLLTSGTGMF